jgi:ComF family protein
VRSRITQAAKWLLNVLLPGTCAHCLRDLPFPGDGLFCAGCAAELKRPAAPICRRCGLPLPSGGASCYDCRGAAKRLDLARAAFVFGPQLRSAVHAFKYKYRTAAGRALAGLMAAEAPSNRLLLMADFMLPVPIHPLRLRERGFNQAAILAAPLSKALGIPLAEGLAERVRDTGAQARLTRAERKTNVAGAFRALKPAEIKGKKILLVDDVGTTLATLEELAGELKKAGAKEVKAYLLAREP